jgi:oligopeptide/dipeptide ABC transporter ATP-binding protein
MSGKHRSVEEMLRGLSEKLKKSGENAESAMQRLEHRLDDGAKSIDRKFSQLDEKFNQLDKNLEKKAEQLDTLLEATEKKLEKEPDIILAANGLKKYFPRKKTKGSDTGFAIHAVDGIDLDIERGETLGIVGESGCGKSTVARILIGLLPPTEGRVRFDGADFLTRDTAARREMRRRTGMVFQDPYGSLDPRMNIADIIGEPLRAYRLAKDRTDMLLKTAEMLEACGLRTGDLFKFPHQFSGGQRQRICIARALVAGPDIVVCDEAVSALDVSVQAQIINLLCDLREQRGLTYVFISHDLEVVRFIADRVAVMYLGKIVEIGTRDELFGNPCHPYTISLLESAPVFGRRARDEISTADEDAWMEAPPTEGCRFRPRCPHATPECAEEPELKRREGGHAVACLRDAGT